MQRILRTALVLGLLTGLSLSLAQVTLTYWQYDFGTRIDAMNQLIEQFNAENPDVIVVQETFPYDAYEQRVAAATAAGQGPDVVQLFYGWVGSWQRAGYIEPLPQEHIDHAWIEEYFIPMVESVKVGGEYYGLPTAVRSLALFYNKDLFRAAGLDPDAPPQTWDEFVAAGKALTVQRGPLFTQIGYGPGGQDHHLIRTVLMNQLGTPPYSADNREVLYGNEIGEQALRIWTDWQLVDEIGVFEFIPGSGGYRDGFINQENIAMIVDGSFAIGQVRNNAQFDWGVTELPTFDNGVQSNFGSFWMNAVTPRAYRDPAVLEASARFITFVTSEEAMQLWLEVVGELPAARSLVGDPALVSDPVNGPFIAGLAYAEATQFVDEAAQRQVMIDAFNRVLLEGMDPAESIMIAAQADQALLDDFDD
ncbi:MAG: extracellular solute-binding protein [Trueperaceae bacterium]|nr:MAG: extracellular solute-binding protein [Trueperaceae bacterium]